MSIISHESHGVGTIFWTDNIPSVPLLTLRNALENSGLDPKLARDLAKRYCFIRAKNKLKGEGLIEELSDTEDHLTFQMSERFYGEQAIRYTKRATLAFDKHNQIVMSDDYRFNAVIQDLFAEAGELYPRAQVNALVKRVFSQHRAVVALRKNGGVYFVPDTYREVLGKVILFLRRVGGEVVTAPVGFADDEIKDKALNMLAEKMRSELTALSDEVKQNGLTKAKALSRWEKIVGQVERAVKFAESLRVNANDILKAASTAEINLGVVMAGDIDTIAQIAQTGKVNLGTLGVIAGQIIDEEMPPAEESAVKAVLAAVPDLMDMDVQPSAPVAAAPEASTPDIEFTESDKLVNAVEQLQAMLAGKETATA